MSRQNEPSLSPRDNALKPRIPVFASSGERLGISNQVIDESLMERKRGQVQPPPNSTPQSQEERLANAELQIYELRTALTNTNNARITLKSRVHDLKSELHDLKSELHDHKSELHDLKASFEKFCKPLLASNSSAYDHVAVLAESQPRVALAQQEQPVQTIEPRTYQLNSNSHFDQITTTLAALGNHKKRKSLGRSQKTCKRPSHNGTQRRGVGDGWTPANQQGGGRGRDGSEASHSRRNPEHVLAIRPSPPRWKLNNPRYFSPPTDGNCVSFVTELNEYRFWCWQCHLWCKHLSADCTRRLPTGETVDPIAASRFTTATSTAARTNM